MAATKKKRAGQTKATKRSDPRRGRAAAKRSRRAPKRTRRAKRESKSIVEIRRFKAAKPSEDTPLPEPIASFTF